MADTQLKGVVRLRADASRAKRDVKDFAQFSSAEVGRTFSGEVAKEVQGKIADAFNRFGMLGRAASATFRTVLKPSVAPRSQSQATQSVSAFTIPRVDTIHIARAQIVNLKGEGQGPTKPASPVTPPRIPPIVPAVRVPPVVFTPLNHAIKTVAWSLSRLGEVLMRWVGRFRSILDSLANFFGSLFRRLFLLFRRVTPSGNASNALTLAKASFSRQTEVVRMQGFKVHTVSMRANKPSTDLARRVAVDVRRISPRSPRSLPGHVFEGRRVVRGIPRPMLPAPQASTLSRVPPIAGMAGGAAEAAGGEGGGAAAGGGLMASLGPMGLVIGGVAVGAALAAGALAAMAGMVKSITGRLMEFGRSLATISGPMAAAFAVFDARMLLLKQQLGNALAPAMNKLLNAVLGLAQRAFPLLIPVVNFLAKAMTAAVNLASQALDGLAAFLKPWLAAIKPVLEAVGGVFGQLWTIAKDLAKVFVDLVHAIHLDALIVLLAQVQSFIQTYLLKAFDAVLKVLDLFVRGVGLLINRLPQLMVAMAKDLMAVLNPLTVAKIGSAMAAGDHRKAAALADPGGLGSLMGGLADAMKRLAEQERKANALKERELNMANLGAANGLPFYQGFMGAEQQRDALIRQWRQKPSRFNELPDKTRKLLGDPRTMKSDHLTLAKMERLHMLAAVHEHQQALNDRLHAQAEAALARGSPHKYTSPRH